MQTVIGEFKPEVEKALVELGIRFYSKDVTLTPAELFYEVLRVCPEVRSVQIEGSDYNKVFEKVVKVVVKAGVKFLQYTDTHSGLPDLSTVCVVVPVERQFTVYEVQDGN